jgi:hypothetical protein
VDECKPLPSAPWRIPRAAAPAPPRSNAAPKASMRRGVVPHSVSALSPGAGAYTRPLLSSTQHLLWDMLGTFSRYVGHKSSQTGHITAH